MRPWLALVAACGGSGPGPVSVPAEIAAALHCSAGTVVNSRGGLDSDDITRLPAAWCERDGRRDGLHISWNTGEPSVYAETEWRGETQVGVERGYMHGRLASVADARLVAWYRPDGTMERLAERPREPGHWEVELGRAEEPIEASRGDDSACRFERRQRHAAVSGLKRVDAEGKPTGWTIVSTADRSRKWEEGMYEHGTREGPWTFFDTCGQPLFELRYQHGRLVGFDGKPIPR
jgi:hypothetical protein